MSVDYSRMKTVMVDKEIEDLPGLFRDLKASFFNVINVGSDKHGTYLYMDMGERKDPKLILEKWINRPLYVQQPTTSWFGRLLRKIW